MKPKKKIMMLATAVMLSAVALAGCEGGGPMTRSEDIKENVVKETPQAEKVVVLDDTKEMEETLRYLAFAYGMVKDTLPHSYRENPEQTDDPNGKYVFTAERDALLYQFVEVTLKKNVVTVLDEKEQEVGGEQGERIAELNAYLQDYTDTFTEYLNLLGEKDGGTEPPGDEIFDKYDELVEAQQTFVSEVEKSTPPSHLSKELEKRAKQSAYILQDMVNWILDEFKQQDKDGIRDALIMLQEPLNEGILNLERAGSLAGLSDEGKEVEKAMREIDAKVLVMLDEDTYPDAKLLEVVELTKAFTMIPEDILKPSVKVEFY